MTNEKTDPEFPQGEQRTLRLTEYEGLTVALAQRLHNQWMPEAQTLIQQGEAKRNEAVTALRSAVEGAFREHKEEIPTAEIKIVNDERGRPAVLVWTDAPKPAVDEAEGEPEETAEAEGEAAAEKKVAAPVPSPANGKHPEAAKRKFPVK